MAESLTRTFDLAKLLSGPYYCTGCAGRVCEGVEAFPGVSSTRCDLEAGTLEVSYDPAEVNVRELERVVEHLALEAADRVAHAAYRVTGLD